MSGLQWVIDDGVIRARMDDPATTTDVTGPELTRARTTLTNPLVSLVLQSRSPVGHSVTNVLIGAVVVSLSTQVPSPDGPGHAFAAARFVEVSIAPLTRCLDEIMRVIPGPGRCGAGEAGTVALSLRSAARQDRLAALWLVRDRHYLFLRPGPGATPQVMSRAQMSQVILSELAEALVLGLVDPDFDLDGPDADPDGPDAHPDGHGWRDDPDADHSDERDGRPGTSSA